LGFTNNGRCGISGKKKKKKNTSFSYPIGKKRSKKGKVSVDAANLTAKKDESGTENIAWRKKGGNELTLLRVQRKINFHNSMQI